MKKRLTRDFYTNPTLDVAKGLLGKHLVRHIDGKEISGKIVETEAYIGPNDKASHSYLPKGKVQSVSEKMIKDFFGDEFFIKNIYQGRGKITKRNRAEYLIGGHVYIYLVYGMYWQFNISTFKEGFPECVLLRALDIDKEADGPGKLCRYLKLDKSLYQEDLIKSKRVWLEDRGEVVDSSDILSTARIGIDYAGSYWSRRKWRFVLNPFDKNHKV